MPVTRDKRRTISYSRAQWVNPPGISLEAAIRQCLGSCPNVDDTRLPLRNMNAEARHRRLTRGMVYLHVAAWTDGEPVSIVPHGVAGDAADLDERVPDDTWDYLDGDGMVLVSGDHCLLMPSGLHPRALELYLRSLLQHGRDVRGAAIPNNMDRFELLAVADAEVALQINREGVKKIDLNVSQYLETARELEEHRLTITQRIGRAILENLVADEEKRRQIEEADNVKARLGYFLRHEACRFGAGRPRANRYRYCRRGRRPYRNLHRNRAANQTWSTCAEEARGCHLVCQDRAS